MKLKHNNKRCRLTPKQKENVLRDRDHCPKCNSDKIEEISLRFSKNGMEIKTFIECQDCEKVWVELFIFEKAVEYRYSEWDIV